MKNKYYKTIFRNLLESLEEEEKIRQHHTQLIIRIIDDLLYDKSVGESTINKMKELIDFEENKDT
jgi:hypothetical protein